MTPVSEHVVGLAILGAPKTDFAATIASIPSLAARVADAQPASELRGVTISTCGKGLNCRQPGR